MQCNDITGLYKSCSTGRFHFILNFYGQAEVNTFSKYLDRQTNKNKNQQT